MFEGKKTSLFWTGLVLLGASLTYFCIFVWNMVTSPIAFDTFHLEEDVAFAFPFLAGAAVFMVISLFMMQNGTRKNLLNSHARRYWVGLVTLGVASIYLLVTLWIGLVYYRVYTFEYWSTQLPFILGPIVFAVAGSYGMKTGIRNRSLEPTSSLLSK
jgi:hypothetical protein